MKKTFLMFLMFFVFVFPHSVCSSSTFAPPLPPKLGGEQQLKANGIWNAAGSFTQRKDQLNPIGSEGCDENYEECLKRRMTEEAHLDYVYTQHHEP